MELLLHLKENQTGTVMPDLLYELGKGYIASLYMLEFYDCKSNIWSDYAYSENLIDIVEIVAQQKAGSIYRIYNAYDLVLEGTTYDT